MKRSWRMAIIGTIIVFLVVPSMVTFYVDWLWFGETGYREVFVRRLTTQGVLAVVAGIVAFGVLWGNLRIASRMISPRALVVQTREGPIMLPVDRRRVQTTGAFVVGGVSLL